MINKDVIFILIYKVEEFVDLSEYDSPVPSGYTREKEVVKLFDTTKEMDDFIKEEVLSRATSYKTFHAFPTSKKIELKEFKRFTRY